MRVAEFTLGVLTAKIFLSHKDFKSNGFLEVLSLLALVLFALTYDFLAEMSPGPAISRWVQLSGGAPVFAFIIFIFAYSKGWISQLLSYRVLIILGEISFAFYMVHQMVLRFAVTHKWHVALSPSQAASAVFCVSILISLLLWKFLEMPCRKKFVDFYKRRTA